MDSPKQNKKQLFRKWENPYISLITTKPDYIVPCPENLLTDSDKSSLLEQMKDFSSVYLEIGSGSGEHLVTRASLDSHSLYIGFEVRYKRAYKTAEKAGRLGLKNLVVIRLSARYLPEIFPIESINGVYINFPDPWSKKKRWAKTGS